jgi:hypothetical protein
VSHSDPGIFAGKTMPSRHESTPGMSVAAAKKPESLQHRMGCCILLPMLSWCQLRKIFTSKPPFPTGLVLSVIPLLAILSAWLKPLTGVGVLSPWLKVAYFATIAYYVAFTVYAVRCPETIKRYSSSVDRIKSERQLWADSNPSHRLDIVRTQLGASEPTRIELENLEGQRDGALGVERAELNRRIAALVDREWLNAVQQFLARTYDEDNTKRCAARCVGTLFLLAFAIGIVVVVIHRSILVIRG